MKIKGFKDILNKNKDSESVAPPLDEGVTSNVPLPVPAPSPVPQPTPVAPEPAPATVESVPVEAEAQKEPEVTAEQLLLNHEQRIQKIEYNLRLA